MSTDNRRERLGSWFDAYEDAILAADDSEFEDTPQLEALARAVKKQVEVALSSEKPSAVKRMAARRRPRSASDATARQYVVMPRTKQTTPLRACFSAAKSPSNDEEEGE